MDSDGAAWHGSRPGPLSSLGLVSATPKVNDAISFTLVIPDRGNPCGHHTLRLGLAPWSAAYRRWLLSIVGMQLSHAAQSAYVVLIPIPDGHGTGG